MTIETQTRDVLLRAADQIDVAPPPIDAMLVTVARRRRRIAGAIAGLSAAVVVVAVAVVSISNDRGSTPATTNPSPSTTAPDTRLAGIDGIAVSVPNDWSTNDVACSPGISVVVFPREDSNCLLDPAMVSAVYLVRSSSPLAEPWRSMNAATAGPIDGSLRFATRSWGCDNRSAACPDAFYAGAVTVVDDGVTIWAVGPSMATVDAVLGSVQRLPRGVIAVPPHPTGRVLADAGLSVALPSGTGENALLETSPTPGRIVPAGSAVQVTAVVDDRATTLPPTIMDVETPTVGCGDRGGATVTIAIRAVRAGYVTLTLESGGQAIGAGPPTWLFAGEHTVLSVPIDRGFIDGKATLRVEQHTPSGGLEQANRVVGMPRDQHICS